MADARIVAHGSARVVGSTRWAISAAVDALTHGRGDSIFLSYFPTPEDLLAILAAGVGTVYFTGDVDNPDTVSLANALPEAGMPLEMVRLALGPNNP